MWCRVENRFKSLRGPVELNVRQFDKVMPGHLRNSNASQPRFTLDFFPSQPKMRCCWLVGLKVRRTRSKVSCMHTDLRTFTC